MIKGTYCIYCPCCGEEIYVKESELDLEIDVFKTKCTNPDCNHSIEVSIEWKPLFHTKEIKQGVCLECNDDVEYTMDFVSKVSKYQDVDDRDYCLCRKCETKLKMEDVVKREGFKFELRK